MNTRSAHPADVASIVAAYAWLFEPPGSVPDGWDEDVARRRLRAAIGSFTSRVLVADAGAGDILGVCTVYLDLTSVRFGPRAWIEDMMVEPRSRGRGIGRLLLREARRWAADRGAHYLMLESATARTDAHRFYRDQGAVQGSLAFRWTLRAGAARA